METEYSFAQRLKELRERRGLSQTDLGNKVNVNPNRISNYELGLRRNPPIEIIRLLCYGLGCTADELLGLSDIQYSEKVRRALDLMHELDDHDMDATLAMMETLRLRHQRADG